MKYDYSSDIKVDLVEQDVSKLSYFDPSDAHDANVRGNHANLVFHLETVIMKNAFDINQLESDSFNRKDLPAKIDYELCIPPTLCYTAYLKTNKTTS
jgi:hypothetical protein